VRIRELNSRGCYEDGLHNRQGFKFLASRASQAGVFQIDAVRWVMLGFLRDGNDMES